MSGNRRTDGHDRFITFLANAVGHQTEATLILFLFIIRHFSCADKATGPVCLCVLITCELNDLWHAAQINKSYSLRGANVHLLSNNWFLGPTQICPQNSISIRSPVCLKTHGQTDIHRDHATASVPVGRFSRHANNAA